LLIYFANIDTIAFARKMQYHIYLTYMVHWTVQKRTKTHLFAKSAYVRDHGFTFCDPTRPSSSSSSSLKFLEWPKQQRHHDGDIKS